MTDRHQTSETAVMTAIVLAVSGAVLFVGFNVYDQIKFTSEVRDYCYRQSETHEEFSRCAKEYRYQKKRSVNK